MPHRPAPSLADSIAAAQAWWREAGVDHAYADEPARWLADSAPGEAAPQAATERPTPPPPEPGRPRIGGDRAGWPDDLAAFRTWWLSDPTLTEGARPRLTPRGETGAEVLMLVPMPEEDDREMLLAGPHGRLLDSFALAADLRAEAIAVAAALPQHTPLPNWDDLAARGMGDVVLHMLSLAAPKRLIVLGRSILPLLGHDPAQAAPAVSQLAIQGRTLPVLTTYAPETLLENARLREVLWRRWLEWTEGGLA